MPRIHPIFGIVAVPLLAAGILVQQYFSIAYRLQQLINDLKDENSATQSSTALALSYFGAPAVGTLVSELGNPDDRIQQGAAKALGIMGHSIGRTAIDPLIEALKNPDSRERQGAAEALGDVGEPAIEPLIVAWHNPNSGVRRSSIEDALANTGEPAVQPLMKLLNDLEDNGQRLDSEDRIGVAGALAKIGQPAIESLINELTFEDQDLQKTAVGALAKIGEPAVPPLVFALNEGSSEQSKGHLAAWTLAIIGQPAVDPIKQALQETNYPLVRANATWALAEIRKGAVNPLSQENAAPAGLATEARGNSIAVPGPAKDSSSSSPSTRDKQVAAHIVRAKSLWTGGNAEGAIAECDAALRLNPKDKEASSLREKYAKALQILNGSSQ